MKKFSLFAACSLAAALLVMPNGVSAQVADSAKADTTKRDIPRPAVTPSVTPGQAGRTGGAISDSAIIAMLQLSHTQQIAAAELALERSKSDRVKRFAEELKTDHGNALQALETFAQRLQTEGVNRGMPSGMARDSARVGRDNNVTGQPDSVVVKDSAVVGDSARPGRDPNANLGRPDSAAAAPAQAGEPGVELENIRALSGHEFDHGFVQLQVQIHETEINHLRNDVIPMIKNSDLKALVQRDLPTLGKHLRDARELQAYLKTVE